jgi:hypothetical protein
MLRTQYIIYITHITMNNYADNTALYEDILREDAVYNGLRRLELPIRDGRRKQRKRKQAQRIARYDSF